MKLFEEFPQVTAQEWEQKILKDLKIPTLNELIWHTPENINIRPFYTIEDTKHLSIHPIFYHTNWEIVQYIPTFSHSAEQINENIIQSLNGGATGIYLEFYQNYNFQNCFNNISLPHIYSNIQISFDTLNILSLFKDIYFSINEYTQQKNFYINIDPIFLLEKYGEWHDNLKNDFEVLLELHHIPVNATLYKESGANVIQELAYTIAHCNEYLYYLNEKKQLSKYQYIHINISVGASFFTEIAKIRALRILILHLLKEYSHTAHIHIHAQTTLINKSCLDIYNNIIRTTTESMSAIFGGANSISILPYDFPYDEASDFSLRIARNSLIIMKEESYFDKVADVSTGNFYLENYTNYLVDAAYQKFLEIEKQNGIINLLEKNILQSELQQTFEQQLKQYIDNNNILIGINKYPNPSQEIKNHTFYTLNPSLNTSITPLTYKRFAEYFEQQKTKV